MSRILLVDDDPTFRCWLNEALVAQGHQVICASNGLEGLNLISDFCPDVIMLDLLMPVMSGIEMLEGKNCLTPVIVFSSKDCEKDRIRSYELGADDYLCKPFSIKELNVRLQALERRLYRKTATPESLTSPQILLDELGQSLLIGSSVVCLTQTEFKLFKYLFERKGQVVTKQELQKSILQRDLGRYDRNLDMHISNTRRKIAKNLDSRNVINTVRGQGYSFCF
ncbi:response regulator transcription factor [Shewanella acanthi]|uniref:response regulator transcription factor n=1 Tax=Shewanella acanthi TaxID=2864212 RepID=UPI001C65A2EF|nr:response regulator transcription factor [Shewanella acanthi]QYJ77350.1 response regulator transcription factor [Shewanella acanthi]